MKHILNNANQGEIAPWVTLDEDGVHYSGNVVIEEDSYEYVDLGLPSGTLWATCNVGANSPEEYGLYFQWGATVGYYQNEQGAKDNSSWKTTPFNNGSAIYNEEYLASISDDVCPNGVLLSQYDAAYANTSGKQKMPTLDQIKELTANTTTAWTSENGVNGMRFTSKVEGYTDKSIFVPASGNFNNGGKNPVGSSGYVWSSSLNTDGPDCACYLYFSSDRADWGSRLSRYYGFAVRGVKNPS